MYNFTGFTVEDADEILEAILKIMGETYIDISIVPDTHNA